VKSRMLSTDLISRVKPARRSSPREMSNASGSPAIH
jgi:hypothetical protein